MQSCSARENVTRSMKHSLYRDAYTVVHDKAAWWFARLATHRMRMQHGLARC